MCSDLKKTEVIQKEKTHTHKKNKATHTHTQQPLLQQQQMLRMHLNEFLLHSILRLVHLEYIYFLTNFKFFKLVPSQCINT